MGIGVPKPGIIFIHLVFYHLNLVFSLSYLVFYISYLVFHFYLVFYLFYLGFYLIAFLRGAIEGRDTSHLDQPRRSCLVHSHNVVKGLTRIEHKR